MTANFHAVIERVYGEMEVDQTNQAINAVINVMASAVISTAVRMEMRHEFREINNMTLRLLIERAVDFALAVRRGGDGEGG